MFVDFSSMNILNIYFVVNLWKIRSKKGQINNHPTGKEKRTVY